jgi:putative tryptophan/tyrosine transport system substrate-binding protein
MNTGRNQNATSPCQQNRRLFHYALSLIVLAFGIPVDAQQVKQIARIGYLGNTASFETTNMKLLRERLRELGYIEGQNIIFENRYWEGKVEHLPALAVDLVRLNCDVVVTSGTEAAAAAKNMITTIPVVMAFGGDALRRGFVADLARPGGNITGLTSIGVELDGKRLELLKEVVPKLSRVGYLWSRTNPGVEYQLKEIDTMGRSLNLEIQSLEVKGSDDFDEAFQWQTKSVLRLFWLQAAVSSRLIRGAS